MKILTDNSKFRCPVEATLDIIGGKWKPIIVWGLLENEIMRYGELKKYTRGISHKILSEQLKELEDNNIINRKQYEEIPPRVEYSLTEKGRSLEPILDAMCQWGYNNLDLEE